MNPYSLRFFLLHKLFFLPFLIMHVPLLVMSPLNFCMYKKAFILSLLMKGICAGYGMPGALFLSDITPLSFPLHYCYCKIYFQLYFCFSEHNMSFFSLVMFKFFSVPLALSSLNMMLLGLVFFICPVLGVN